MSKRKCKNVSKEALYEMNLTEFTQYLSELDPKEKEEKRNIFLFMLGYKTGEECAEHNLIEYRKLSTKYYDLLRIFKKLETDINNLES